MPFLGSEARAAGIVNRYQLRTRYQQVYRDVYAPLGQVITPVDKAMAAWLWSGRRGVVARTAFDLGRRKGQTQAVVRVDALLQATHLKLPDVQALIDTHAGVRGMVQLRRVLDLADYGGESPQETRLRLLFTKNGMRPTRTQIEVFDGTFLVGRIDMGWPEWKVGVQYDGIQHWEDPRQRTKDIDQNAEYRELGWRIVHVGADLMRTRHDTIIARTRAELRAAGPANENELVSQILARFGTQAQFRRKRL